VGKGVTFDTGGISIKPSSGMNQMKGDMSGAAAVLSAMKGVASLTPKLPILALIPLAEICLTGTPNAPVMW
jgi:leucyl aminopeptidase